MSNNKNTSNETSVAERKPTVGERFVNKVEREFQGSVGHGVELTDEEKQLANNLFVMIDSQLKEQEADRLKKGNDRQTPFKWDNVNMQKLSTDAVHRVRLGLDASIKNHIHVIPYFNGKTKKYDIDLQVGYKGKAYYRKRMAVEDVKDIRYELIHESDEFSVIKKDMNQRVETYEFKVTNPFDRGKVIGGFGYIEYEDESKNKVVTVPESEFVKVKNKAKTNKIWNEWPEKMRLKTLVHRVTDELDMDPKKINPSYSYVERQEDPFNNPDNEVRIEQPEASQREDLDFDDTAQLNGDSEALDIDFEESAGSNNNGGYDRDAAMEDITSCAKAIAKESGEKWIYHIKKAQSDINPEADNMMGLSDEELESLRQEMIKQHDEAV